MKSRKWRRGVGVGGALLLLMTPLVLSSCGDDAIAKGPTFVVNLQETTATVTASWSYNVDASGWTMNDLWRSERQSGGDAWTRVGTSSDQTITFSVPRSTGSAAVGLFCVTPRRTDPQPKTFAEVCGTFNVPMQGLPDVEIDSLNINVTDSLGNIIAMGDSGSNIWYKEFERAPGVVDTIWHYDVFTADGTWLKDHAVGYSSTGHGMQLTALLWKDGQVIGCNGDCRLFPELELPGCVVGVDCPPDPIGYVPWPGSAPIQQAYNPFPPPVDVLGR